MRGDAHAVGESIRCFLAEASGIDQLSLRRYTDQPCTLNAMGCHDAMTPVVEIARSLASPEYEPGDARWPRACLCGHEFAETDHRQVFREEIYRGTHPERGPMEFTLRDAPAGALWRAPWFEDVAEWRGPDGHSYMVMTPAGEWVIDGTAITGGRWQREGQAPRFTVRPSILIQRHGEVTFHAFLTDGVLVPC